MKIGRFQVGSLFHEQYFAFIRQIKREIFVRGRRIIIEDRTFVKQQVQASEYLLGQMLNQLTVR